MHNHSHHVQVYTYRLCFRGQVDEDFLPAYCPPETTLQCWQDMTILSGILTDQSGIIGLIRRLHNLGCTILEMTAQPAA